MSFDTSDLSQGFHGDTGVLPLLLTRLGLNDAQAAQLLLVSEYTVRRWRCRSRPPSPTAVRLLAIFAGFMPWKGWKDWEVHGGYLFPPGYTKHGILPQEFFALVYYRQLMTEYRRKVKGLEEENAQLKGRLADLEDVEGPPLEPDRRRHWHRRRITPR